MTLSAEDFDLLLQANRILSSKLNVDEVLQAVMELATKVVRAEASSLLLLDEKNDELYFNVALGSVGEQVKEIRIKVGEGIAGWVAKERLPLIVNDVTKDKRFTGKVDKSTRFQTKSIMAVPLLAKGKLIGVVEAINKKSGQPFTEADQEAFEIFASQAAIAIENARLFSAVKQEKEKLAMVFSEMSEGVIYTNAEGEVVILNAAGSRFLGLDSHKAQGKLFTLDLFQGFESSHEFKLLKDFKEKTTLVDLVRREGKELYLSCLIHGLQPNQEGFPSGWLVILRDSTEEKKGERLKRNFLSLISHKLKTPLTVIVGYAPVLMSNMESLNDFQKKAVKAISDQGEQLSALVDKLLRFTIVESETTQRKTEPHALDGILAQSIEAVKSEMEEQHVVLSFEKAKADSFQVRVEESLAVEVFKNLLENAVKFNNKDKKSVMISAKELNGAIQISVEDNGAGIPPEETEKIFQKFYQVENYFTGQVPGAGLGLALCKKVVEEMGGRIQLESKLNVGTRVSVILPGDKKPNS